MDGNSLKAVGVVCIAMMATSLWILQNIDGMLMMAAAASIAALITHKGTTSNGIKEYFEGLSQRGNTRNM